MQALVSDLFRGLQADVVEAASNALLGVAGMSLDPSLGPIMSPRPVPMLVIRCIHTPGQCLHAAKLAVAGLPVLHSGLHVNFCSYSLQPGIETLFALLGCFHHIQAAVCRRRLTQASR